MSSPNMFNQANNTTFTGVANAVAGNQINHNTYNHSGADTARLADAAEKSLKTHNVPGAAYNSSQREHARSCQDGTRTDILLKIVNWVDGIDGLPIYWLSGPAGSGKSAIAQSIAEECKSKNKLAASFFFSRGDSLRDNTARFFLTLAYQLTILVPSTKSLILNSLMNDPLIPTANLETQFKSLIQGPILALERPVYQMVVIVDSLDECVDKDGILKVIRIIADAIRKERLPLYFFFTSRPERHIEAEFRYLTIDNPEPLARRLSLEEHKADADIRMFLLEEFGKIRKRRDFIERGIEEWPSPADLKRLVEKSEGSFQWASTVVNVVGGDKGIPSKRLQLALDMHAGLDPLYRQVISSARSTGSFDRIIGTIIVVRYRLPVEQLGLLLNLQTSEIRVAMEGLESVCKIPQDDKEVIQPFHASLYDFFADSERSKEFFVDPVAHHSSVLLYCLRIIKNDLMKGEIDSGLARYVCGSWCHHLNRVLMHGGEDDLLYSQGSDFLVECLRGMAYGPFEPWFKAVLQGYDEDILRSRRDLGSTIAKLRRLPGNPISLFHVLDDFKQRLHSEVQLELINACHHLDKGVKTG